MPVIVEWSAQPGHVLEGGNFDPFNVRLKHFLNM